MKGNKTNEVSLMMCEQWCRGDSVHMCLVQEEMVTMIRRVFRCFNNNKI